MSISPLAKKVLIQNTEAPFVEQRNKEAQERYEKTHREIEERHRTPFERACSLGSIATLPEVPK